MKALGQGGARGTCLGCGQARAVRTDGLVMAHRSHGTWCVGSHQMPVPPPKEEITCQE